MIHQFTTDKGLKVIGIESHKSPVVSIQIWTRNGSADERAGDEGLSHFIEHLVFKGTKSFEAGEIAARVEACGGEINAYTSFDQTVYYITISKEFYAEALQIIAEMVSSPRFDPQEVDREREVVIEEIKRSNDSLGRRASRLLFSSLYKGHPYSIPVIGYEKNIREVSVERLRSFFLERYVAQNMFLVVTGDFEPKNLQHDAQKAFEDLAQEKPRKPVRPEKFQFAPASVVVEEAPFEEAVIYMAWPGVKIDSDDLAALECLCLILGQGASSRLYRQLRLEKDLVNSIGAGLWAPSQAPGFISVSASLNLDKIEKAIDEITWVISSFLNQGVTEAEVEKARTNLVAEEAYVIETVGGLARKYGGNYEATEDLLHHEKFHRQLAQVSALKVQTVAQKYLRNDKQLAVALVPREKDKVEKSLRNLKWHASSAPQAAAPSAPREAQIHKPRVLKREKTSTTESKLMNRVRLFLTPSSQAPIYNLRLALPGGSRIVPQEKSGLAELAGRTWSTQTRRRTELQIREACDSAASSLYSYSGRNTMGLVVDGLAQHQDVMSELLCEMLTDSQIDEAIVTREKNAMLESLRSRKDSPATVASVWFQKMLFKDHPYQQDPLGTAETVSALTVRDVETYLGSVVSGANAVAALTGDFNESLWMKALEQLGVSDATSSLAEASVPQPLQEDLYHYEFLSKEQSHVIYGFHGLALDDPQRYTLQVLEAVLSGQGGRLFIELRDKASLAYSVSPLRMEGVGTGYFATYIGCSPEKVDTAIQMMKQELQKMAEHKISPTELRRAQSYLIGGHDIGLQKNSSISSSIALNEVYGNTYRELHEYARWIREVSADQVQQLAQKLFAQKSALVVVGPQEPSHRPKKSFS